MVAGEFADRCRMPTVHERPVPVPKEILVEGFGGDFCRHRQVHRHVRFDVGPAEAECEGRGDPMCARRRVGSQVLGPNVADIVVVRAVTPGPAVRFIDHVEALAGQ